MRKLLTVMVVAGALVLLAVPALAGPHGVEPTGWFWLLLAGEVSPGRDPPPAGAGGGGWGRRTTDRPGACWR